MTRADEVQIYEAIMVDSRDAVTTGLLQRRALRQGQPAAAARLRQGDGRARRRRSRRRGGRRRLRRRRRPRALPHRARAPASAAPLTVEAELLYQSIAYRWAENLRGYDAEETQRFGRYYAENAAASAARHRGCDGHGSGSLTRAATDFCLRGPSYDRRRSIRVKEESCV